MKSKILLIVAIVFAINVCAQTPENKWGVGIHFGSQQYNGDFGNGFYVFDQPFYAFGGISLARNITEHLDLEFNTTFGEIGHTQNSTNSFRHSLYQFNFNAKYNFFKYDDVKFRPFVFAGLGYLHFSDKRSDQKFNNMQLPDFGAGVSYKVSPEISVVFKETFMYSDHDNIENRATGPNEWFLQHSIGVVFHFGKAKDSDGDGFSDKHDLCPEIAGLAAFNGCPDTDGDGITDAEDNCPEFAGTGGLNGCPDSDGDGVTDANDKCPNVSGLVALDGCPDSDGDGVTDALDKCPNVKGLKALNGCPDSDGDGVTDALDKCPNLKGSVALNGCPDSDGDGVSDIDDHCPEVAGLLENKGCPEVKQEDKEVLAKALHGVKFKSGKNIITSSSYPTLDNIVALLVKHPEYKLRIDGHTDSQGDEKMNLDLSTGRAQAVQDYLMAKGIDETRLVSTGFGETKPIADNATAAGRAENRRVEINIEF